MNDNALMILQKTAPTALFAMNGLDEFINKIRGEVASAPSDISTKEGRTEIASLAYKVAKSKTALEKLGKESIEDLQKTVKAVTAERIRGVNALQEIQDNIRKPLTEWENADKERIAGHEASIEAIKNHGTGCLGQWQTQDLLRMNSHLEWIKEPSEVNFEEFKYRYDEAIKTAIEQIESAIAKRTTYDTEQAELARLRTEQAAREQKEREDKIAADAAEKARLEAERLAKEAADKLAAKVKADADAAEKAIQEASKREEKAEADKIAAAAKADKDKLQAVEAEKQRAEAETKRITDETAKREADTNHKKKINNDILVALMSIINDATVSKLIITAIAKGEIPHIKINY